MRSPSRRASFGIGLLFIALLALLGGIGAGVLVVYLRGLPSLEEVESYHPSLVSKVYASDEHTVLGEFFEEKRLLVPLERIPRYVLDAVVATEDRKFYDHSGIDFRRIVGAALSDIKSGSARQGGSTITQQLARNLFLSHDRVWSRKIKEALLALKIERTYSKDEILERYLNQIYFGHGAYGIEAAAQRFFSKHVDELTLAEATLLVGLPGNPAAFSPILHPDAALGRRRTVLTSMEAFDKLTAEEAEAAAAAPLELNPSPRHRNRAPHVAEWIRRQIEPIYGSALVHQGGLRIYTTIDPDLQDAAQEFLESGLKAQEEHNHYSVTRAEYLQRKAAGEEFSANYSPYVQGALLAVDPRDGRLLAMIGSRNYQESQFNRAVQAPRQVGSLFKPIVMAQAFRQGKTAADIVLDGPIVMDTGSNQLWEPHNYDAKFLGPITLRRSLMLSRNLSTIRIALEIGIEPIIDLARQTGITAPLPPVPSLAIGAGDITLWEMIRAYTVFADHGVLVEPYGIERIEDASGRILESRQPQRRAVLSEEIAFLTTSLMRSVIDEGTGRGARSRGFKPPAAGKTGTTDNHVDAWFLGFTPDILTGVWVGFDDRTTLGRHQSGSVVALPIWTEFMKRATAGNPPLDFPIPEGIVSEEICTTTGLRIGPHCPPGRMELFITRSEPQAVCDHPRDQAPATESPVEADDDLGLDF
jgi:penicillin-binding protein 1A